MEKESSLNPGLSPEIDESEKRTTILRQYLRDLFNLYVERRAAPLPNSPESIGQILAKRRPDVVQTAVELAASQDLPIEASFEHRHEVKGDDPAAAKLAASKPPAKAKTTKSPSKKGSSKMTPKQRAKARRVAQKFVKPVATTGMVAVNSKTLAGKPTAPAKPSAIGKRPNANSSYQAVIISFWLALVLGLVAGLVLIAR